MIILLQGADTFSLKERLNFLKESFVKKYKDSAINILEIDSKDFDINKLRSQMLSGGLFAAKRFIIIKNLLSGQKDKKFLEELGQTIESLADDKDNIVILQEGNLKTNEVNKKIIDYLTKQKYSKKFDILARAQIGQKINKMLVKYKMIIDAPAKDLLIERCGSDLWLLNNEMNKLLAFKNFTGKIILGDVDLMTRPGLEEKVWPLIDALAQRQKSRALKEIENLMAGGADLHSMIIPMLAWQIRIILKIKSVIVSSGPTDPYHLAAEIKEKPYAVQKAINKIDDFGLGEIKNIYHRLMEIDISSKTNSKIDPIVLIDLLILSL
ncbi:MAG: DNA polymerase III subunit delta [Patescibacteria group bacterium]